MNKFLATIIGFLIVNILSAQNILGKWKTVDDNTGTEKSIVKIYEENGKIYGKIVEIFNEAKQDVRCIDCDGEDEDRLVLGMNIIKGLEKDGSVYNGGTITNPENGKVYDCRLKMVDNKLQVRGYVAFFYRTQYWVRM